MVAVLALATVIACETKIEVSTAAMAPEQGRISVLDSDGPEGDTGWWPTVQFDSHDVPHLSYCDAYHGNLRYATRRDGQWHIQTVVEKGAVGKYTALDVDSQGRVAIAFYDQDTKYFRFAQQKKPGGQEWDIEKVSWGLEAGMAAELLFDERNSPHLYFYVY
jgi:hypothetical protein